MVHYQDHGFAVPVHDGRQGYGQGYHPTGINVHFGLFADDQGFGQLGELHVHFQLPGDGVGLFIEADHLALEIPARSAV